ncbi:hypothetical protein VKT23_013752 [Stygiomarasmius scandens]|uniref:Uncharacterized protein n=1 Tax=Marasmiellus scandens TaxID=2682957 RepID=A0ABR1J3X0_9AGAR
MGYIEDESMSNASTNWYNLEAQRDPDGPKSEGYAGFAEKHVNFFMSRTKAAEYYEY